MIEAGLPATVSATDVLRKRLAASLSALNASVVLVHAAADGLRRPQLTVLVLDEAIAHDDLQIHILLVLVNPYGVPAHRHLQHLATIARSIARPEQLQALLAAKDEATARLVLLGDD